MTANPLYSLRLVSPDTCQIAKFDADFNVEAVYTLTRRGNGHTCDCPAGQRTVKLRPCKHQRMLPLMLGAANVPNRFFEPETRTWRDVLPKHITENMDQVEGAKMTIEEPLEGEARSRVLGDSQPPVVGEAVGAPDAQPPEATVAQIEEAMRKIAAQEPPVREPAPPSPIAPPPSPSGFRRRV